MGKLLNCFNYNKFSPKVVWAHESYFSKSKNVMQYSNLISFCKLLLSFCFSLLFLQDSNAQAALEKGYYLSQPDSVKVEGYFHLKEYTFGTIDFYLSEKKDKVKVLRPEDICLIATDKGSVLLPLMATDGAKSIFIQRIIAAGANLYEGKMDKADVYFINTDTKPDILKVNKTSPQAFLSAYLGEKCAPSTPIRYHKSELVGALNKYGKCMGYPVIKPSKKPFMLNVSIGLNGTYYNEPLKTSGLFDFPVKNVEGYILGGDIRIGILRNFFLRIGFSRTEINIKNSSGMVADYLIQGQSIVIKNPYDFSYYINELPFELVWYMNKG
ncbi:MAG TPA: hypothetical protein DCF33_15715, partial [Saprospirales bacterium]|nr:hypothetical protein [Saprospirales bacterium]